MDRVRAPTVCFLHDLIRGRSFDKVNFDSRKTAEGDDTYQEVVHPRVGDWATLALVCVEEVVPRVCQVASFPLLHLHPTGTLNVL
jgi:hypothetical protein